MDSVFLITISAFILAVILIIITIVIIKSNQNKKYKKEIEELDIEKNSLLGVPVLSEITKVKELVKTDNLKEKMEDWDNTFKLIRDEAIPSITDSISDADFLIDRKEYKQAIRKMANIEMELRVLKKKTDKLLEEVQLITKSEERNRTLITKLKIVYREQQNKFERTKKEFGVITASMEEEFSRIDKLFAEFERAMDNNDYVSVEKKIVLLDDKIKRMDKLLADVPTIVLMATVVMPNKIEDTIIYYNRMRRDGYPLDYLNVEYNIKETEKKVKDILDRVKVLNLEDVVFELKTIVTYYDSLYNDFEYEKLCKKTFESNVKSFKAKLVRTNKIINNLIGQLDSLKETYDLSKDDVNRLHIINTEVKKIKDSYNNLMDCSKNHTFPYSRMVKELDVLIIKVSKLEESLNYDLKTIGSMKEDEVRAREQLDNIKNLLKKAKNRIRLYNIPVIPDNYFVELQDASDAIKEIQKELNKKPINIETLNIRVDTARDLVFKVFNTTNSLLKTIVMLEETMVYGNRYRSYKEKVNEGLIMAEKLFFKGEYKKALEVTMNAIDYVEPGIHNRIMKAYNEN
ncbi:MAG TPA: hypothetical protein DCX74_03635 [Firmicutes bacterium]|nr:hypothetical protein [Bacillota bacterium]